MPLVVLTVILLKNVQQTFGALFEPYKVLGVHRRAEIGEIRKTYKRLAKEWHPDKVTGDKEKKDAEAKFIEINRAYELLRYIIFYMMPIKFPNDIFCYLATLKIDIYPLIKFQ